MITFHLDGEVPQLIKRLLEGEQVYREALDRLEVEVIRAEIVAKGRRVQHEMS